MEVTIILAGMLVSQAFLFYWERKRLIGMIFSKSVGDLKYLEEEPKKPKKNHTNFITKQREEQVNGE